MVQLTCNFLHWMRFLAGHSWPTQRWRRRREVDREEEEIEEAKEREVEDWKEEEEIQVERREQDGVGEVVVVVAFR